MIRRRTGIEPLARRALRRAAFWRAMTALLQFPCDVLKALAQVVLRVGDLFDALAEVAFSMECDAARQYRTLTGVDLGFAVKGDIDRYAGTNPKALAMAERDEYDDSDLGDDDA